MRTSSLVRFLPALVLLGSGLAVTAAPTAGAADPAYPYPFKNADGDDTFTLVDRPGWDASLVTRGGSATRLSGTLGSTVAQEYGLSTTDPAKITDALRQSWVEDQPYAALDGSSARLVGADSMALGYLSHDKDLDAVYLVKGAGAGGKDRVLLAASQSGGYPIVNSIDVAAGALSITTTERGSEVGQAEQPAYIWVRYADHLAAIAVAEDYQTMEEVTVLGAPTGTLLDLQHRGTWLDTAGVNSQQPVARRARALAVLQDAGGAPDTLRASMLIVSAHTDGDVTTDPQKVGTVTLAPYAITANAYDLPTTAGRSWQADAGRVRYDWVDFSPYDAGNAFFANAFVLALSGRSTDAGGGNAHNALSVVTASVFGPGSPKLADNGSQCGDKTAMEIDVQHVYGYSVIGCATVDTNGNADRLVENIGRVLEGGGAPSTWQGQHSNSVNGEDRLGQLRPRVVLPCLALNTSSAKGCSAYIDGGGIFSSGTAAMQTTVAGDTDSIFGDRYSRLYQTSDAWLENKTPAQAAQLGRFLWTPVQTPGDMTPSAPLLAAPLPLQRITVAVDIPDSPSNPPVLARSKPIPIAFLAAPPQVAGAEQAGDAPEFAATSSSGAGSTTTTSSRVGVHVGMEYEDPLGANGISIEANLENEVTDDSTLERTITTSQAYRGLVDDDVVVYRSVPTVQWRGTVVSSSTGVGAGTRTSIDFPTAGVVTSAASVTSLARTYPDLFGPSGQLQPVLDAVFSHDVGDPGSYMPYGDSGADVDQYCDGSLSPTGDRQLKQLDTLVPGNPYLTATPVPPQPDILVSDRHDVQTGTGNAEGATFGIENSATNSRVQTNAIDVSITGKAGYIVGGVSGGYTWGKGWSSTLSDGSEFSSFVGNIPSSDPAFDTETYSWRSFLCQKTIPDGVGAPVSAWVLDYAVDGYAGSGGLVPLGRLSAESPVESTTTDPTATVLRWSRDAGTVKSYDWRVEAVGTPDTRSGRISFATPKLAQTTDTATHQVPVTGGALLPGQLYRWKVTAADFNGHEVDGDWQYFVTAQATRAPAGPTAVADRFNVTEDKAITLDVLANDVNPSGAPVSLQIADDPVNGTVSVVGGAVRYDPKRNRCGVDTFDYRVTDAAGRAATGTVILRVQCVNDEPVALNDRFRVPHGDRTLEVSAPGVLGNDRDADHDDLVPKLVHKPRGVQVEFGERGALTVTLSRRAPRAGTFAIRYRACDEESCSDVGVVTVVL